MIFFLPIVVYAGSVHASFGDEQSSKTTMLLISFLISEVLFFLPVVVDAGSVHASFGDEQSS